ncbi:MAG: hypothetical protein J6N32_02195 [Clostridia bacterium]|nr:hypothetical protein [Clostridia bacterium]MBP3292537.1 hypothetical protein [Clostridia bacterium]
MKHTMRTILMFVLVLGMLFPLTGCSAAVLREAEIETLLADFEDACTAMDVDAALDCIDPKIAAPAKAVRGVVGYFLGETDLSAAFFDLLKQMSGDTVEEPEDFFGNMHIDVGKVRANSKQASAAAVVTCSIAGKKVMRDAEFRCIYDVGRWYISGFSVR